ncbi:hypothetical protein CVT26_002398 [Gymnopilus dilepis]|uniref:Uncharacterized protein n=1 Tax=Gymnopilus dilepis TaxID=231916 RepID=A0A409Y3N3_9AGAR|nr:hypothetical protein CVT26_002398 [Gymnopilus dilepis]
MRASTGLGNDKPHVLVSVERIMWNTLFLLADGQLDPRDTLLRLKADMSWTELRKAVDNPQIQDWFRLGLQRNEQRLAAPDVTFPSSSSEAGLPRCHSSVDVPASNIPVDETTYLDSAHPHILLQSNNTMYQLPDPLAASPPSASTSVYAPLDLPHDIGGNIELHGITSESSGKHNQARTPLFLNSSEEDFDMDSASDHMVSKNGMRGASKGRIAFDSASFRDDIDSKDDLDDRSSDGQESVFNNSFIARSGEDLLDRSLSVDMNIERHDGSSISAVFSTADNRGDERDGVSNSINVSPEGTVLNFVPILRRSDRLVQLQNQPQGLHSDTARSIRSSYSLPRKKRKRAGHSMGPFGRVLLNSCADDDGLEGTESNPIDVDQLHIPSLWEPDDLNEFRLAAGSSFGQQAYDQKLPRHNVHPARSKSTSSFSFFSPNGDEHAICPEYCSEAVQRHFDCLMSRAMNSYVEGRPPHLAKPEESIISVMQYCDFVKLGSNNIQSILSKKNLVVTGVPNPLSTFDHETLSRVYPLHCPIYLRGTSITKPGNSSGNNSSSSNVLRVACPPSEEDVEPRIRIGTLQEFIPEANRPPVHILATDTLPLSQEGTTLTSYSTDAHAWHHTRGRPSSPLSESFPTASTRWVIVSTAHATDSFQVDPAGFNSFQFVVCGKRLILFSRKKAASRTEMFDFDDICDPKHVLANQRPDFEAVVLCEGHLLFTRANQPRALYCKDSAIIRGGYFYLTGLMRATSYGIMRNFLSGMCPPVVHQRYFPRLLRSIADFYRLGLLECKINPLDKCYEHLPKVHTFEGLSDLLSLCNLLVLANVLDPRTYSPPNHMNEATIDDSQLSLMDRFDRTDISRKERLCMAYARGVALSTMRWVREFCEVTSADGTVISDFPFKYLTYQMVALLRFKKAAERQPSRLSQYCSPSLLQRQIENVVKCDPHLVRYWSEMSDQLDDQLLPELVLPSHSVRWRDRPQRYIPARDLLIRGTTPLDLRFSKGEMLRRSQDVLLASDHQEFDEIAPVKRQSSRDEILEKPATSARKPFSSPGYLQVLLVTVVALSRFLTVEEDCRYPSALQSLPSPSPSNTGEHSIRRYLPGPSLSVLRSGTFISGSECARSEADNFIADLLGTACSGVRCRRGWRLGLS